MKRENIYDKEIIGLFKYINKLAYGYEKINCMKFVTDIEEDNKKEYNCLVIDSHSLNYKIKDAVADYLTAHTCNWDDEDGLEVAFYNNDTLKRTGIKVKNVEAKDIDKIIQGGA